MAPSTAAQLAPLIGLDEQTVSEQILPHLSSMSSANEVKNYLLSLLVPGTASQEFIQAYIRQRFHSASAAAASNPTSTWAARPAAPAPTSSRSSVYDRARKQEQLEQAFQGGPQGKLYRKGDLDPPHGATSSTPNSTANSSRNNSRSASPATASRTIPALVQAKAGKGKARETSSNVVDLPESVAQELREIDRDLRNFATTTSAKRSACFCSARQHPLSLYTPICPRCALVLCQLNQPNSPCPSCSHSHLLSPALLSSYVAQLEQRRAAILEREQQRRDARALAAERERLAIKFPELASEPIRPTVQPTGYAAHAGGGSISLQARIERAYETGTSLNGRDFGREKRQAAVSNGGGKVLRLDGKGKVKVQTSKKKPTHKTSNPENHDARDEVAAPDEDDDDDNGMIPWIDPTDDGIRSSEAPRTDTTATKRRAFENPTLKAVWVEREELSRSIVDDEGGEQMGVLESVPDTRRDRKVPGIGASTQEPINNKKKGKGN
ncbi:uncharacterized protein JCM15063_001411 [Sporobolomyces koalae]|uniref:uncharacterized protein n=1 Tax=Sporobolomyces koalae TaxID=500713 RepID=UPI00316DF4D1